MLSNFEERDSDSLCHRLFVYVSKNTATGTRCSARSVSTYVPRSRIQSIAHLPRRKPVICSGKMPLVSSHQVSHSCTIRSIVFAKQLVRLMGQSDDSWRVFYLASIRALGELPSRMNAVSLFPTSHWRKNRRRLQCAEGPRLVIIVGVMLWGPGALFVRVVRKDHSSSFMVKVASISTLLQARYLRNAWRGAVELPATCLQNFSATSSSIVSKWVAKACSGRRCVTGFLKDWRRSQEVANEGFESTDEQRFLQLLYLCDPAPDAFLRKVYWPLLNLQVCLVNGLILPHFASTVLGKFIVMCWQLYRRDIWTDTK